MGEGEDKAGSCCAPEARMVELFDDDVGTYAGGEAAEERANGNY